VYLTKEKYMKLAGFIAGFLVTFSVIVVAEQIFQDPVSPKDIPSDFVCTKNLVGWNDVYVCDEP